MNLAVGILQGGKVCKKRIADVLACVDAAEGRGKAVSLSLPCLSLQALLPVPSGKVACPFSNTPTQTEARQFAAKFFGKAIRGKAAYAKVIDNLSGYGLELKSGDSPAQRLLCPRSKGKN